MRFQTREQRIDLALLIGIPAGVISAVKRGSAWDVGANVFALWGLSTPNFWLGIMYAQVDSVAAARRELGLAVEMDSTGTNKNTGVALRQLGFYKLLDRDYPEAIKMLERAVAINDKDSQAWVWLAQGYQNSGNRSKACEAYGRVLDLDSSQPDALKGKKVLGCGTATRGGAP